MAVHLNGVKHWRVVSSMKERGVPVPEMYDPPLQPIVTFNSGEECMHSATMDNGSVVS